ncbi:MAG: SDR family NAD(P)-dependent oxidoreductase, partial [Spirochaetes bacterium]|nr:SDR family NAD(P)-dependent oxidoreductase [Spirochaetota bacterium]MBU0957079.1 SDR family NAD(P)-dependent oxidoreductase [Spirochaetota bacterium]
MLQYLKQYNWPDMKQVIENGKRQPLQCSERLDGKLCLITGATSGVGLEAAKTLYAAGADLLLVNRNAGKSEALAVVLRSGGTGSGSIQYLTADFSELSQVRQLIANLQKIERPIDVL